MLQAVFKHKTIDLYLVVQIDGVHYFIDRNTGEKTNITDDGYWLRNGASFKMIWHKE